MGKVWQAISSLAGDNHLSFRSPVREPKIMGVIAHGALTHLGTNGARGPTQPGRDDARRRVPAAGYMLPAMPRASRSST
jgi:hypothetical protein